MHGGRYNSSIYKAVTTPPFNWESGWRDYHAHTHTHIQTQTLSHTHTDTNGTIMHTHIQTQSHSQAHICTHIQTQTLSHTHRHKRYYHAHTHTHSQAHICTHTHTHTSVPAMRIKKFGHAIRMSPHNASFSMTSPQYTLWVCVCLVINNQNTICPNIVYFVSLTCRK